MTMTDRAMLTSQVLDVRCPRCNRRDRLTLRWFGNEHQVAAVAQTGVHACPAPETSLYEDIALPW